jgi:hypothetical protein
MARCGSRPPLALNTMVAPMAGLQALPGLDASSYVRSPLHADSCAWVEKNCYVDVWIELLHSLGLEPTAALSMTVAVDFEGDQWTFFKPPHDELRDLYGIDVQELTVWRTLLDHAQEHLAAGKMISTESDAFWLPDTAGTDYRRQHTKSTIVLANIDVAQQRLGYFHNTGYFELAGEDFRQLFRVDLPHDPQFMPLYAELVRTDRVAKRSDAELRQIARKFLVSHLVRRPVDNPLPTALRARAGSDAARGLGRIPPVGVRHDSAARRCVRTCVRPRPVGLAAAEPGRRRSGEGVRPDCKSQQDTDSQGCARRQQRAAVGCVWPLR